jgi:hypothetical protein
MDNRDDACSSLALLRLGLEVRLEPMVLPSRTTSPMKLTQSLPAVNHATVGLNVKHGFTNDKSPSRNGVNKYAKVVLVARFIQIEG